VDLEQIGAGSFGAVYRGRDSQSPGGQQLVALKVFHNSDEEVRRVVCAHEVHG
jgi:serine/threonine protein kinase